MCATIRSSFAIVLLLTAAACTTPATTEAPRPAAPREAAVYSIDDFLDTISFGGASFSHDNARVLVSSDASGVFNAHAISIDGGATTALTESDDSIFSVGYFPQDERFLYTADEGGDELNHLYVREPDGKVVDLTPGEGLKARFFGWTQDETGFYVASNERNPKYFDVYRYDVTSYERSLLYQNDEGNDVAAISPDGGTLALQKTISNADTDVFIYDVETAAMDRITDHEGAVQFAPQTFTRDGDALLLLTDLDSPFTYLVRYDLATGAWTTIETADWDLVFSFYSLTGRYRVTGVNNDGRTELRLYNGETGDRVALPELGDAEINSVVFSRDESKMAFYASSSREPRDLYVQNLDGGSPARLTRSLNPKIIPEDLVAPEVVRFASHDGTEVPGILYRPHSATAENQAPALIWVHGGPGGQSRVGYSGLIQYLVNHGYVVYAINNRGSSGYGKAFFHLDDHDHGNGDLDDCVASKQMLIDTGYVDADRIGIIGGSYGGFMVLAALTFRPEAFDVGVDIFGVANWYRTLNSIPPWWESGRTYFEAEFGTLDDETYLKGISPLFHAENVVRPLMVLQGANDPRVLQVESDEMVEAIRDNNVPIEYIVFADEGHGFRKKANQKQGYRAILSFLEEHLAGTQPATAAPVG